MHIPRVTLRETDSEYLLSIHPSQKERAKRIEGRNWDAQRKCWVYPRISRVYNAIVGEFGEDLEDCTAEIETIKQQIAEYPESATAAPVLALSLDLQTEVASPSTEVDSLQGHICRLANVNESMQLELQQATIALESVTEQLTVAKEEIQQLRTQLAAKNRDAEFETLIARGEKLERLLAEERTKAKEYSTTIYNLKTILQTKQTEIERLKDSSAITDPSSNASLFLIQLAMLSAGRDEPFGAIVKSHSLDAGLVLRLHSELENAVRGMLPNNPSSKLNDLLVQAQERDVLPQDQIDLAHFIRRQRNIIAHGRLDRGAILPRVILVLFAAALLWPELSKKTS